MHDQYTAGPGGAWMRAGFRPDPGAVDLLVFDVDGVLLDTEQSYPEAISRAVQTYFSSVLKWPGAGTLLAGSETALFKQAGGFNNDWQLAMAAVLFHLAKAARIGMVDLESLRSAPPPVADFAAAIGRAGGGLAGAERVALSGLPGHLAEGVRRDWDCGLIERLCCEFYGGTDWCEAMFGFKPQFVNAPGLFNRERSLIRTDLLAPWAGRIGVYTGRVQREAQPALLRCAMQQLVPAWALLAADGCYVKPDPGGLRLLAERTGARCGAFFGDNIDDLRTVLSYRATAAPGAPAFVFAGILGGALGDRAGDIFAELGADVIAPDVNSAVAALT